MTSKFDEIEASLPKEHWICQSCKAKKNLIRPHDPSKPTFCKDCLNQMRSNLDHALYQHGVKWLLDALISAIEKVPMRSARKFVINHIIKVFDERIEEWEREI